MALAAIKARVVTLTAINDLIKRSLAAVKIHAHLESTGISKSDGKQPDGATIVPWKGERVLVWDATCPDTFACHWNFGPGKIGPGTKMSAGKNCPPDHIFW